MRALLTAPRLFTVMLSILGMFRGKILSTPMPLDILRIVKVSVAPAPRR